MKRRDFLIGAVTTTLAAGAHMAAQNTAAAATGPETTAGAAPPGALTTDALTAAELATADKVEGRAYRPADHALMLGAMQETRAQLAAIRRAGLEPDADAPATQFQPLPPGTPLPTGRSRFRLSRGAAPAYDGDPRSLAFATVVELGRLVKARKVTSVELARLSLERLKTYGPRLNCVVNLCEERALRQAAEADAAIAQGHYRGPLHGIPYGAKDLLAARGAPTTYGARPYEHQLLDYDATVIERLDAAGAVLVAKLSMGELAMGDVWFGGTTRCPWDPARGASGSSAGPGSATAAGLVGFSIGTETLGSIVSPCVRNGVTGLRPTFGRVSRHGAMALSWTMDKIGPMCRGVEDCAAVFDAIRGPDGRDLTVVDAPFAWDPARPLSEVRVGVDHAAFDGLDAGPRKALYAGVLDTLRGMGVPLIPVGLPKTDPAREALAGLIIGVEGAAAFQTLTLSGQLDRLVQQEEGSWPNTFRVGSTVPAADYVQALRLRHRLQVEMAEALRGVDVYLSVPFEGPSLAYTNLTGHPTAVTRCGMLDGVPQSVEFVGGLYREAAALRVALAYERATPWHRQWPDVDALPATPPPLAAPKGA